MTRGVFTHYLAFDGGGTPPVPGEVTIDRDRMLAAIGARATAQLTGGQRIRYRTVAGGTGRRGEALWDLLDAAVRARGIEVRYQATAERPVLSPDGSVTGLAARHAGEPVIHETADG